jgi:GNAT superfamily N-acetyltransferase
MFNIRPTLAKDVGHLPAVERSAAQSFLAIPDLAWVAADTVQSEARHHQLVKGGAAWVAVGMDDKPVGFLNAEVIDGHLHICELSVQQDCQSQGLGKALMEAARHWADVHAIPRLTLITFRNVPWNELFYKSLGFTTLEERDLPAFLQHMLDDDTNAGLPRGQRCVMSAGQPFHPPIL